MLNIFQIYLTEAENITNRKEQTMVVIERDDVRFVVDTDKCCGCKRCAKKSGEEACHANTGHNFKIFFFHMQDSSDIIGNAPTNL